MPMDGPRVSHGPGAERVEDAALLTGRGRFLDDLGMLPGCLHAAILRSPHAHAGRRRSGVAAADFFLGTMLAMVRAMVADPRHRRNVAPSFRPDRRAG